MSLSREERLQLQFAFFFVNMFEVFFVNVNKKLAHVY